MRNPTLAIVLPLFLVACGSSAVEVSPDASAREAGPGSTDGAEDQTIGVDGAAASGFCTSKLPLASVTDVSGVWVAKLTGAQIVTNPLTSAIHNQNVYYQLLTIQQSGAALTIDGRYCDRTELNDPKATVPILIPDAWAHTETPIHRTGDFTPTGSGYSVLNLPTLFEAFGAELTSAADTLPTAASDARVYDQDNDSQPGITIRLAGSLVTGSVYSVQTQTTSVVAIPVAAGRIEGSLAFSSDQSVLASDPSTIQSLYGLSKTTADYAACSSSFVMVKLPSGAVDGGSPTCAWVRANEATLFQ